LDYLELSDNHSIAEYIAGDNFNGQSLLESNIRQKYGVSVIAIKRDDDIIVNPDPTVKLRNNDILIVIGSDRDLNIFERKMM
jgi:trk system potassium uptake protein TrkA